ncbi:MAG: hypothetical protein H0X33_13525 [Taibaiella sp.]|nr:hypothetical protein [Taibaiella sp.]
MKTLMTTYLAIWHGGGLQGTESYKSLSEDDQMRIQNRESAEQTNKSFSTESPDGKGLLCK